MNPSLLSQLILYGTVFTTGAVVLIVEVAAVRMLTPIFGGSLYVLSSVLSVVLLALSLGYFFGGRIADTRPHPIPLYLIISASGLCLLVLQYAAVSSLDPTNPVFSPIIGPLLFSLVLFFLPAFLLGMDSPYVIKLMSLTDNGAHAGRYAGTTFFWSTIGSITGSLSAGFWLIPTYGVSLTVIMAAITLLIIGTVVPWFLQSDFNTPKEIARSYYIASSVLVITALVFLGLINRIDAADSQVIASYDGLYTNIRVEERLHNGTTIRSLRRDTNHSSAVFLENYDHVFAYTQYADLYTLLNPSTTHFLLIGGGAYTIPRRLVAFDPELSVDVVEIEPSLFDLAHTYFDLHKTDQITNYPMDARVFLDAPPRSYDVIFTDAMSSAFSIPFHLTTKEFYTSVQRALREDGAMIANYIGVVDTDPTSLTSAVYHTMRSVFPYVAMYKAKIRDDSEIQNIIFIATQKPVTTAITDFVIDTKESGTTTIGALTIDTTRFNTVNPRILTDDHAPIEYLMANQMRNSLRK